MKKFFLCMIIVFLLPSIVFAKNSEHVIKTVEFADCVDGDTAWFLKDGEKTKVRFLAIDTKETVHPTKEVEAFGKDASEYTCNKMKSAKKIELEYDSGSTKTDKYGRDLAWVFVDGELLQESLVRVGYASVAYLYGNYLYTEKLQEVECTAKLEGIGIWEDVVTSSSLDVVNEPNLEIDLKVILLGVLLLALLLFIPKKYRSKMKKFVKKLQK